MLGIAGIKLKKYPNGLNLSAVADYITDGTEKDSQKNGITHKMIQSWIKIYLD